MAQKAEYDAAKWFNAAPCAAKKGFHQKDAAPHLGVEQPLLSRYENGMSQPDEAFLLRAEKFYEVPFMMFALVLNLRQNPSSQ